MTTISATYESPHNSNDQGELPAGLTLIFATEAHPDLVRLKEKGWHIGPFDWTSEEQGLLRFTLIRPGSNRPVHVECHESQLGEKFRQYLSQ